MNDSWTLLAIVIGSFLLAGSVKGVIGMGLPTVSMGLLGLALPPAQAAALLVLPAMLTNLWQMAVGPHLARVARRLFTLQLGVCAGTWASTGVLTGTSSGLASGALGAVLVAYSVTGLLEVHFHVPRRIERWLSPAIGVATGLITGATGIFVVPAVPYLAALDQERDELIQALGLSFVVSSAALGVSLAAGGAFDKASPPAMAAALGAALAGMWIGQRFRGRLDPAVFRRSFFVGLLTVGLYMVWRAI